MNAFPSQPTLQSAVGGGEIGVSLHAVLTDVETFDLFFFSHADATEESADHLSLIHI